MTDHVELCSWNVVFKGEAGSLICDGREGRRLESMDDSRSETVGLAGGAINAMEKSVSPDGEDGVTIMAGSAAFSSTRGKVRSNGAGIRV